LIPKQALYGMLYGLCKNSVIVIDSNQTKFGYKITLFSSIRGKKKLLEAIQRSLLQHSIESRLYEKESKSRPKPLLKISGLDNLMNLCAFMLSCKIPEDLLSDWLDFQRVVSLMNNGQHYTTKGFDEILKIKGVLND